jgi:hypothetical protein
MSLLLANDLSKLANAVTDARPVIGMFSISGNPSFPVAFKGQKQTDLVFVSGVPASLAGAVAGTETDQSPALAVVDTFSETVLYLAWKVAGQKNVKVLQAVVAEDEFPIAATWGPLPTTTGPANPAASTDAAPAMAIGAKSQLYMVWKTPGGSGPLAWSVYDGAGWSAPAQISGPSTDYGPALAGWNTSGPGSVRPLCLAWKDAKTDGVFFSSFTPGASVFRSTPISGATTDVSPAVAAGPVGAGASYYVAWKDKKTNVLTFSSVKGDTAGATTSLPQALSHHGPAVVNYSNNTSGAGAEVFNNLIVAFAGESGDVWRGDWSIVPNRAPFPGAGTDFGRSPDEGSNNYILYGNTHCESLDKVVVTINVTSDLDCPQGFSFQLNANVNQSAINYSRCAWQQCGFGLDTSGNLTAWVNNWIDQNTATINTTGNTILAWSKPTIPAGTKLTITLKYDKNLWVVSSLFEVVLSNGDKFNPPPIDYVSNLLPGYPASGFSTTQYLAPVSVLQMVIVGFISSADADFKSGAGSITVSSSVPLIAGDSRPSCSNGIQTTEQSNIIYGPLSSTSSRSQSQLFWASPSKN